jgi:hypothetical protein
MPGIVAPEIERLAASVTLPDGRPRSCGPTPAPTPPPMRQSSCRRWSSGCAGGNSTSKGERSESEGPQALEDQDGDHTDQPAGEAEALPTFAHGGADVTNREQPERLLYPVPEAMLMLSLSRTQI